MVLLDVLECFFVRLHLVKVNQRVQRHCLSLRLSTVHSDERVTLGGPCREGVTERAELLVGLGNVRVHILAVGEDDVLKRGNELGERLGERAELLGVVPLAHNEHLEEEGEEEGVVGEVVADEVVEVVDQLSEVGLHDCVAENVEEDGQQLDGMSVEFHSVGRERRRDDGVEHAHEALLAVRQPFLHDHLADGILLEFLDDGGDGGDGHCLGEVLLRIHRDVLEDILGVSGANKPHDERQTQRRVRENDVGRHRL